VTNIPYKDMTEERRERIRSGMRRRYAANPEKYRAAAAKRAGSDAERKRIYMRAYYQANRPRLLAAIRKRAGVPEPTRSCPTQCEVAGCRRKAVCADHEHLTGTFRGWLCRPCNLAATKHHTPALLRALADYLEQHS